MPVPKQAETLCFASTTTNVRIRYFSRPLSITYDISTSGSFGGVPEFRVGGLSAGTYRGCRKINSGVSMIGYLLEWSHKHWNVSCRRQ